MEVIVMPSANGEPMCADCGRRLLPNTVLYVRCPEHLVRCVVGALGAAADRAETSATDAERQAWQKVVNDLEDADGEAIRDEVIGSC
jgi:hypothetical protein